MLTAHDAVQRADDMPTIAAARAEWEASRQDVRSARANRFPTISVGVTNNSYLLSERIAGQNSSDFANTTRYGVFLSGRIALGGGARQQINAAQAASQAAQSAYDSEVLRQDMALRSLQREQNDAEVRVSGTGRVITVLEQARDLYWQEYVLSKRRLTEVFDIEREIYQSRVDQLQARADRLGAIAEQLGIQGQLVETLLVEDQADVRP
jgi:adhesin transport system outer membrane protein